jgi:hypothetical protein
MWRSRSILEFVREQGRASLEPSFWLLSSRIRQNAGEVAAKLAHILANAATKSYDEGISTTLDDNPREGKH